MESNGQKSSQESNGSNFSIVSKDSSIAYLSSAVTPNCSGIIWLTKDELNFMTPGVYEFNYLLNGQVTKSISNKSQNGHLFMAQSFGRPFFVSHNLINSKNDFEKVYQHLNVASNILPDNTTVLIFNQTDHNIEKQLSNKYQQVNFKYLNLETKVSS